MIFQRAEPKTKGPGPWAPICTKQSPESRYQGGTSTFVEHSGASVLRSREVEKNGGGGRRKRDGNRAEQEEGNDAMGAALCRHQHPSLRLQRPFVSSSSLPLRLPHHLPHQSVTKSHSPNLRFNSLPLNPNFNCRLFSILSEREKSATKEAISLFAKVEIFDSVLHLFVSDESVVWLENSCLLLFLQYIQCCNSSGSEENSASKRRKLSEENVDGEDRVNDNDGMSCTCLMLFNFGGFRLLL